jgi:hypothetical protein
VQAGRHIKAIRQNTPGLHGENSCSPYEFGSTNSGEMYMFYRCNTPQVLTAPTELPSVKFRSAPYEFGSANSGEMMYATIT